MAGRPFTERDNESALPVAIISQSLADTFFAGTNPVGQSVVLDELVGLGAVTGGTREIVGVVSDFKDYRPGKKPIGSPRIYEPLAQQPVNQLDIVVRSDGDPLLAGPALRERTKDLDPRVGVAEIQSMGTRFENSIWQDNFFVTLMGILGGLALVLSSVGVYGVVSYATIKRTREFGIRAALGAQSSEIAKLVLRKTARLAAIGITLGLLLALVLGKGIQVMLHDTNATDPLTLGSVCVVLALVTLLAGAIPALRATRVSPMECLRVE